MTSSQPVVLPDVSAGGDFDFHDMDGESGSLSQLSSLRSLNPETTWCGEAQSKQFIDNRNISNSVVYFIFLHIYVLFFLFLSSSIYLLIVCLSISQRNRCIWFFFYFKNAIISTAHIINLVNDAQKIRKRNWKMKKRFKSHTRVNSK